MRLLAVLSEERRRAVLAAAVRRRYKKGEIVFHDGDPGDALHLIASGRVAVRVTTPMGDVATLQVLGPGECFGEGALLSDGSRRAATVQALEPLQTMVLSRSDFVRLRDDHPDIDALLVDILAARVQQLTTGLTEALYVPAEQRVLRRLAELADLYADHKATIVIPLTQDDLATMAGTTRPTANRVLNSAEDRGAIALSRGRIEVTDLRALRRLCR